jgi:lysylphosphatidylglycerol synthetase-like protein (DUF2156 family)
MPVKLVIRNEKDFGAGLLYLGFAAAALWIGRNYPLGTAGRMGPGYFPIALAGMLALIGAVSLTRSFLHNGPPVRGIAWKPLTLVLASTALFGFLINAAGLVVALTVLVLTSAAASARFRVDWRAALGLIALVVFCALVFVKGLGVPAPLFGFWFGD